jgi:capsule assembly protein Wzi
MMRALLLAALLLGAVGSRAVADAGWFESGDTVLRNDLLLLNDAGVIRLPVNQWPLPRAAVRYAIENGAERQAMNQAVMEALARVRARIAPSDSGRARGFNFDSSINAGQPGLLRDFDTLGRDEGELTGRIAYSAGERAAFALNATAVADPEDGDEFRLDGSHATVQWGNWLLSAHALDRWWGPGHEGSLILSSNARPMPTLMVERATAQAFETKWLSWLGPWRMSFGLSQMENDRQDIDSPLFMAWRFVVMPFRDIELGFSRTAQFCGEGQVCSLESFKNMLIGNDNLGFDTTPETEPGNQMAGFDIRWNSPIGSWPYAVYSQYIGEDESSYTPAKYLAQLGLESWKPFADGSILQMFLEYSSTTCSANTGRGPYYNCAYNQGLFNVEGYRYKGRVIGYTSDRDSENYSLGATFTTAGGELWSATLRSSRLNRDDDNDVRNTVATFPTDYNALEVGWQGKLLGEPIAVDLGLESTQPVRGGDREVEPFGFIRWTHEFAP